MYYVYIMYTNSQSERKGFTILELLIVVAIIGIIIAIVMVALSDARKKGLDSGRKAQIQEYIKVIELYYGDVGVYPNDDGGPQFNLGGGPVNTLIGTDYLSRVSDNIADFKYCVSANGKSFVIAVDTDDDFGGSDYCHVTRGVETSGYGCDYTGGAFDATDPCASRF